jgi:hypothetical protein
MFEIAADEFGYLFWGKYTLSELGFTDERTPFPMASNPSSDPHIDLPL